MAIRHISVRILPVLLADIHSVHIHAVLEPPLLLADLDVVCAVLPLPHQAVVRKGPVLKAVRPPPLAGLVVPLIPELDSNLQKCQSEPLATAEGEKE